MVCGDDGGFVVRLWYVVMLMGLWCIRGYGDDGGFLVLVCYVVMIVGLCCVRVM